MLWWIENTAERVFYTCWWEQNIAENVFHITLPNMFISKAIHKISSLLILFFIFLYNSAGFQIVSNMQQQHKQSKYQV